MGGEIILTLLSNVSLTNSSSDSMSLRIIVTFCSPGESTKTEYEKLESLSDVNKKKTFNSYPFPLHHRH